ncbi:MAG: hypothetical protein OSB62_05410 [Alphaproteobacteria bacterium]|nr:hypothetical protein [Alphaproteobacteria bacterium]
MSIKKTFALIAAFLMGIMAFAAYMAKAPQPHTEPIACLSVEMFHLSYTAQVNEHDRWEASAENAASALVAKRMGANLWQRYKSVPSIKSNYLENFKKGAAISNMPDCDGQKQGVILAEMLTQHQQIMKIYTDIVAADGNRR